MKALTGAAAAAILGLDGFREIDWPILNCSPASGRNSPNTLRTRQWMEPMLVDDQLVAHPALVLRHLGNQTAALRAKSDLTPLHRIELAVEHALRANLVTLRELRVRGSKAEGDAVIREILRLRGNEPPTESYAETRAAQRFRPWGLTAWRQFPIYEIPMYEYGRARFRADFAIAFKPKSRRPEKLTPKDAVLVEIDSREFHANTFDQDHEKRLSYQVLGFAYLVFTPNQIERTPRRVQQAIERELAKRI